MVVIVVKFQPNTSMEKRTLLISKKESNEKYVIESHSGEVCHLVKSTLALLLGSNLCHTDENVGDLKCVSSIQMENSNKDKEKVCMSGSKSIPVADNVAGTSEDNIAAVNQLQCGGGESSFSMADPLSGLIRYSGPIKSAGSISHRSDARTPVSNPLPFPCVGYGSTLGYNSGYGAGGYGSYGGMRSYNSGGLYGNSMYRGGYGGLYGGGSSMYGGGMYNSYGGMGGMGMGMGMRMGMGMGGPGGLYGDDDPNNPCGAPSQPPGFWISLMCVDL